LCLTIYHLIAFIPQSDIVNALHDTAILPQSNIPDALYDTAFIFVASRLDAQLLA
jgi:hypothetical protein